MGENTGLYRRQHDSKPTAVADVAVPTSREQCAHCRAHFDLGDDVRTRYVAGVGFEHYHAGCAAIAEVPGCRPFADMAALA